MRCPIAADSKPEWRDCFAVWKHWNSNGEYLTYTVPPGMGMPVWRGTTASQPLKQKNGLVEEIVKADGKDNAFWLDGGAEQIVVDPKRLDPKHASKRELTDWGYEGGNMEVDLVGVPALERNWK